MTTRVRMLIATTVAVAVQAVFVSGYYLLTDGCFCATLDSTGPAARPALLIGLLNAVDLVGHLGVPGQVGDLATTLERALLNFLAWAALVFLALTCFAHFTERVRRR